MIQHDKRTLKIFYATARQPGAALSKHNYTHVRQTNEEEKNVTHTHSGYRDTDYQYNDACHVSDCKWWQQQQYYHRRGDDENINDRHNKSKSKLIMTKLSSNAIFLLLACIRFAFNRIPHSSRHFWINEINSLNKVGGKVFRATSVLLLFFSLSRFVAGQKGSGELIEIRSSCVWYSVPSSGWKRCGKHMPDSRSERVERISRSEMANVWRKTRSMFLYHVFVLSDIISTIQANTVRPMKKSWYCQRASIMSMHYAQNMPTENLIRDDSLHSADLFINLFCSLFLRAFRSLNFIFVTSFFLSQSFAFDIYFVSFILIFGAIRIVSRLHARTTVYTWSKVEQTVALIPLNIDMEQKRMQILMNLQQNAIIHSTVDSVHLCFLINVVNTVQRHRHQRLVEASALAVNRLTNNRRKKNRRSFFSLPEPAKVRNFQNGKTKRKIVLNRLKQNEQKQTSNNGEEFIQFGCIWITIWLAALIRSNRFSVCVFFSSHFVHNEIETATLWAWEF